MRRRTFLGLAGAAAAFPRVAFAQQAAKVPRVVLASSGVPTSAMVKGGDANWSAFVDEMESHGFVEGRTIIYERYLTPNDGVADENARKIVASAPDAIFWGGPAAVAKSAIGINTTIPMVAYVGDMLTTGLVANLAHPGGNITGISAAASGELQGKLLGLLLEAAPNARRIGYFVPGDAGKILPLPLQLSSLEVVTTVAKDRNVSLVPIFIEAGAATEANFTNAFGSATAQSIDAVQLGWEVANQFGSPIIAKLAVGARLPAISPYDQFAPAGGLISYATDFAQQTRQAADYVALVLNGTKPGDLPVLQPTVFNLVINLKTANAIGLTIPQSLVIQAAQVIQ